MVKFLRLRPFLSKTPCFIKRPIIRGLIGPEQFLINTYNEFSDNVDPAVKGQLLSFMDNLKGLFIEKLKMDSSKDEETLLKQALLDVGLNAEEAIAKLDDQEVRREVKNKEAHWQNVVVRSVPTIVFNGKSSVTGAQPVDVFKRVLKEMISLS